MQICYLAHLTSNDVPSLVRLYTDPITRKYLGGALENSKAITRAFSCVQTPRILPIWSIRSTTDHRFLGTISLDFHHDGLDIEVSYELLPESMGKGYATQALSFVLSYSFNKLNLKKIIAETQTSNKASIKLLKRIGMSFEKNVKRYDSDQSIYSITNDQYLNKIF